MTDLLFGCATEAGIAVAEFDVLLASRAPYSVLSTGATLLLDRLVMRDTCGADLLVLISPSLPLDLVGALEVDFFLDCDVDSSGCGGCRKWDRKVEAILRLRQAARMVTQTLGGSCTRSLGHMLCDIVGLVLGRAR